ncbi:MAG: ribosomal protein L11 methyltransferase [Bacteroidia bacterium]|nr:MAG: ribosomal protein L11 methyltransferase [Bacteroidia bacterium]
MHQIPYWQYNFITSEGVDKDILITLMSDFNFEGFLETENGFVSFIPTDKALDENIWLEELKNYDPNITYSRELIEPKNWNEEWEKNYDVVKINDQCEIYASFHVVNPDIKYPLYIDPKMSFGTGHHATTFMMCNWLFDLKEKLQDAVVLDVGCGTGVLGILAKKLGSHKIYLIDNDPICVENTTENLHKNFSHEMMNNFEVGLHDIESFINTHEDFCCDVILANIQKNVILHDLPFYEKILKSGGLLLVSGILIEAEEEVINYASTFFNYLQSRYKAEWASLLFQKK